MFITPRVVENEIDIRNVIDDLRRRMGRLEEEFPPKNVQPPPPPLPPPLPRRRRAAALKTRCGHESERSKTVSNWRQFTCFA